MFRSLGCVSKPICPSQLPPPASLSRHVRRPSCCQAACSSCSFSLGKGRAVSLTQMNVFPQKHELKPPLLSVSDWLGIVEDLSLSSSPSSLGMSPGPQGRGSKRDSSAWALWCEGKHSGSGALAGEGRGDLGRRELNGSLFFPSN